MLALLLCTGFVLSAGLTAALRRYALARHLIDVPNARSSHTRPTPRGGGVAIVLTFLLALPLLAWMGALSVPEMLALGGAGLLVAAVGFLDDHGHIDARWRLLAHFAAAAWGLAWIGGLPVLSVFGTALDWGMFSQLLAAVYLVWLLNLYNFMDGIDGLAGVEAVSVCLGGALLYWLAAPAGATCALPLMLLAAVAGFLCWNFPPAKIFMGDAGSGFLGITLGLLSIQAARTVPEFFWAWIILLGVFVVDATVTLLRRVVRGQKFYEAHRSHAYQYVSRRFGAHRSVTLAVGAINLFWLLPIALAVGLGYLDGIAGVTLAYAPLVWLAIHFKAGAAELQEV
ncbi:glycosyltransferase family 4 protein [Noviherbaspirillum cavernae]|uniref:Glycosyltransferase family 4 protein n=1 Tax=Noviherbaspirillum cavernae TaxID=2320862 RepID=A0A418X5G8_9BURK|nr:glycosyltransferase family 4 protein [Noviherbaspirillum cavernae]RJG07728.1 glycosyltransferase family 4 protein [Noviherbaspirillum cavernae]